MAERERKGKQLHEIIRRSGRPAEYKSLVLKTGEEWKGQKSEIQIMPDGKKQKKVLSSLYLL